MLLGKLDRVMVRMIGLQHDFARSFTTPGSTGYLRQQLKRTLGSAEIGEAQRIVRADHAHHRHSMHVMTFGDHLRADQQIDFAGMELIEHAFKIMARAHGITIQPADAGHGKCLMQTLFHFFRSRSQKVDVLAAA